jgi:pimeloyl-ACP methyl ester carboxylesterase
VLTVDSVDGVRLAVHEKAGSDTSPPLLISHATGFHAHCYQPVADALGDRFHVFGVDHRGHGASTVPDGWDVDWSRFGVDTVRVAEAIAPDGGLVGIGHSMGGASLLMAAHARPGLFRQLTLFEPIAHRPVGGHLADVDMREIPIVKGAFRRTRRFGSRAEARANYAEKPPLSLMRDDVLFQYVEHGFRDITDDDAPAVELRCSPELEGGIFMGGRDNGVWQLLADIQVPCRVISGMVLDQQPSASTESIADELPNGEYVLLEHQTHLGPFSHPEEFAGLVPD